jgi:hypothetical protein
LSLKPVEGDARILQFARAAVVGAGRGAHPAEVEAQNAAAGGPEGGRHPVGDGVVQVASGQRVRVAHQGRTPWGVLGPKHALQAAVGGRDVDLCHGGEG